MSLIVGLHMVCLSRGEAGPGTLDLAGPSEPGIRPKALRLGDRERKIPAHIHLDITAPGHAERRLQLVFSDDPLLADPYWKDWIRKQGQPVLEPHPSGQGIAGTVTIIIE